MPPAADRPRLLSQDVLLAELEAGAAGGSVVAGTPDFRSRTLHEAGDVEIGLWEMTPGVARDVEVDEVFAVLEGAGSVRFEDGEELELRAGTVVRLRAGERVEWTVTERVRKLYIAL